MNRLTTAERLEMMRLRDTLCSRFETANQVETVECFVCSGGRNLGRVERAPVCPYCVLGMLYFLRQAQPIT